MWTIVVLLKLKKVLVGKDIFRKRIFMPDKYCLNSLYIIYMPFFIISYHYVDLDTQGGRSLDPWSSIFLEDLDDQSAHSVPGQGQGSFYQR